MTGVGQSRIVNRALQDIGMGRYQWELFVLCGFGWFADEYAPNSNDLTQLINECAVYGFK
jgi:hypothetical protein